MKKDFKPYKIGTIFNPLNYKLPPPTLKFKELTIKFPSRLNAMAIDPSKITSNKNMVYTPGEVIFSVKIYKKVTVKVLKEKNTIKISQISKRRSLIKHAYFLMKEALKFDEGLHIDVENTSEIKHSGLGSSSGLIASVAAAINEIFGNPIPAKYLAKYLAQNHGEEIKNDEKNISPVQCIGGSAISGLFEDGVFIIAGQTQVVGSAKVDPNYKAVIGIPNDYIPLDAETALKKEIEFFPKFLETGRKFGQVISYDMIHKCLPSLIEGNIKPLGDLIFDYRFHMGSIENCSFQYPQLPELANKLAYLKKEGTVDVLAISSVGPGFFAITQNPTKCAGVFKKNNMTVYTVEIENDKYQVI